MAGPPGGNQVLNEGQGSACTVCGARKAPGVRALMRTLRLPDAILLRRA